MAIALATLIAGVNPAAAMPAPESTSTSTSASAMAEAAVPDSVSDSVVRLYYAVFDREPDSEGLAYWVDLYSSGTSLEAIATQFIISQEWQTAYGNTDDESFIDILYANVLRRAADADGRAYWIDVLDGDVERSALLTYFSESQEFVALTETSQPTAPLIYPSVPANSGTGKRIIYDNGNNRVWLVDANERILDSYLVSGRANTPSPGTYSVFSKSPLAWAGHDGITMEHMVRFTYGRSLAIGFHAIPRYRSGAPMQTTDELGTYQSAGCVRQEDHKAEALYKWAEIGTTVVVVN